MRIAADRRAGRERDQLPAQSPTRRADERRAALLQAVSAVDANTVWIGGSGGTVLRTVDGGNTWTPRPIPGAERLEFRGIHAISASEAWAMSAGNGAAVADLSHQLMVAPLDGAVRQRRFDGVLRLHHLLRRQARCGVQRCVAGRTTILRTTDGGDHWNVLPVTSVPAPLKGEGGFASSNSCAISVDRKHGWIAASEPGARVFRTDDAGATWSIAAASTPFVHDSQAGITGLSFRDTRHGIGVAARVNRRWPATPRPLRSQPPTTAARPGHCAAVHRFRARCRALRWSRASTADRRHRLVRWPLHQQRRRQQLDCGNHPFLLGGTRNRETCVGGGTGREDYARGLGGEGEKERRRERETIKCLVTFSHSLILSASLFLSFSLLSLSSLFLSFIPQAAPAPAVHTAAPLRAIPPCECAPAPCAPRESSPGRAGSMFPSCRGKRDRRQTRPWLTASRAASVPWQAESPG